MPVVYSQCTFKSTLNLPRDKFIVYSGEVDTIGKRIKGLRVAAELTQEQLGSLFVSDSRPAGFGKQTIAAWESDRNKVTSDHLLKLCEIFKISADYLLKGEIKSHSFFDLQGLEAQIVMLYRNLNESQKIKLSGIAHEMMKEAEKPLPPPLVGHHIGAIERHATIQIPSDRKAKKSK